MLSRAVTCLAFAASAAAFGCSDSFQPPPTPADVAGSYTINLTETAQNECQFMDWQEGKTTSNLPFEVTQDGADVTGALTGVAGGLFELYLGAGASTFTGTVTGNDLELVAHGSRAQGGGNCSFTLDANVSVTVDGATLQGTLDFTSVTNGSPDCASAGIEGCVTEENVTGARPQ